MTPLMPPMRNMLMKPSANSIAVLSVILPRYRVPSQLNILIPVGMAMRAVMKLKNGRNTDPVVNMWCAHTVQLSRPMPMVANTNAL
jgi:hypothetical protein